MLKILYAVIFVYLQWFRRNLLLKFVSQRKIEKTISKTPYFLFMVVQGHRCWYPRKARQQCLLRYAASLCLSATVLTLDDLIVVK